jgi:hypothetical protein
MPLEHQRTIPDTGKGARRERQIVVHEIEFCELVSREKYSLSGCDTRTSRPPIESSSVAFSLSTPTDRWLPRGSYSLPSVDWIAGAIALADCSVVTRHATIVEIVVNTAASK